MMDTKSGIRNFLRFSICLLCGLFVTQVAAENQTINTLEELPRWELGLGLGGLSQPYYAGTRQRRNFLFPTPIPIYRGNILKSDEEGLRAELADNSNFQLNISMDFNPAVDSDKIELRQGMPDVDSRFQIGPSLVWKLKESTQSEWLVNFPLRASFSIGKNGVDDSGVNFSPNLTYYNYFDWQQQPWRFGFAIGPQFGTRDYQNLYYGVDPEFATDSRPAFSADGGYSGFRSLLTLRSKNRDRLWVLFLRYENIDGATFDDSPLIETNGGFSAGIIFSKFLMKSNSTVTRRKHG